MLDLFDREKIIRLAMASSLISNQISVLFQFQSIPKTPYSLSSCIPTSTLTSHFNLKLHSTIPTASSQDVSSGISVPIFRIWFQYLVTHVLSELIEDSKFVPLNFEDPNYGPPALLLLGFQVEEAAKIQQLLKELDGEFLEVIFCIEDMINRSLWEAVNTKQSNLEASKVAKSVPRICFLSGLNGEEMMMFIDAFQESGLEPPIFAALVPNSADKPLAELIDEIMGDHEMMQNSQEMQS